MKPNINVRTSSVTHLEGMPVQSMIKSSPSPTRICPPPSELAAVAPLTPTDAKLLCALVLLESMAAEMLSKDKLEIAFLRAEQELRKVLTVAELAGPWQHVCDLLRRRCAAHPLACMF